MFGEIYRVYCTISIHSTLHFYFYPDSAKFATSKPQRSNELQSFTVFYNTPKLHSMGEMNNTENIVFIVYDLFFTV